MGRIPGSPADAWQALQDLRTEFDRRLRASHLGHMTARGGTSRWATASSGSVHTSVGDLGDGTNGLSTTGRVTAAGAVSGASVAASGGVSAGGAVSAGTSLTAADHNAGSNVPTLGGGNGAKIWIQASDPGASAANGDLWFAA